MKSDVLITDSHESGRIVQLGMRMRNDQGEGGFIVRHNFVVMKKTPEKSWLHTWTTLILRLLIRWFDGAKVVVVFQLFLFKLNYNCNRMAGIPRY